MDFDKIVYSTRSLNIGERILMQRVGRGDWEAVAQYIMVRTNLPMEEIMQLKEEETVAILKKINDGVQTAVTLEYLSRYM